MCLVKREGEEIGQTVSRKLKPGDSFRSTKGRKRLRRQARSAECSVCFGISASPSRVCRKLCAGQADCNVLPPINHIPDEEEHGEKCPPPWKNSSRSISFSLVGVVLRMRVEKVARIEFFSVMNDLHDYYKFRINSEFCWNKIGIYLLCYCQARRESEEKI